MKLPLTQNRLLISIITPSFNRADLIGQAIDSVIKQDYSPVEQIVIDGGSTDGTLVMLARYPHIKVVSEPDNGMYDALNKGLNLAHGEIIGFLNTDDLYAPNIFKDVVVLFANPAVEAVAGRAEVLRAGEDGRLEAVSGINPSGLDNLLEQTILGQPAFNAWFFRRSVFERIGAFDTGYRIAADRDFMIRLALAGVVYARTERTVYLYLQHAGSLTFNQNSTFLSETMYEHVKMTDGFLRRAGLPEKARQYLLKLRTRETIKMAEFHLFKLDLAKAWFYTCVGIRFDRGWPLKFINKLYHSILVNGLLKRIGSFYFTFRQSGIKGITQRLAIWYHKKKHPA
jgi:glycosyltransferase involved in cell wall biosynthesis